MKTLDFAPVFSVRLFGREIPISSAIIGMAFSILLLSVLCVILGRNLKRSPGKRQLIGEMIVGTVGSFAVSAGMKPEQADKVVPYVLTLFLFITTCNVSAIFEIRPPAQNPAFAFTLALCSIAYILIMGFRLVGIRGFFRALTQPIPALLPFNLLDYVIKPISLTFRLFGNVFGAYILMQFIHLVVPLLLPALVGLYFDIVDGIIQGLIFSYLTLNSVAEIVEKAEAHEESASPLKAA